MDEFIPFIIIGLVIFFRIIKAAAERQQSGKERQSTSSDQELGEDVWQDWRDWAEKRKAEATTSPSSASASSAPSSDRQQQAPRAKNKAPLAAAPATASAAPSSHSSENDADGTNGSSQDLSRSYDYYQAPAAPKAPEPPDFEGHDAPYHTGREVGESSLERAFPRARRIARNLERGDRTPIVISVKGTQDLRKAVLLNEALSRPRSFDV